MAHSHDHSHPDEGGKHAGHDHTAGANERSLAMALGLTSTFLVVEFAGGVMTRSLALISDAAHMLTDVIALAIALLAIRVGGRAADSRRTFGYARFEILAAAVNAMLLFGAAVYIVYEAYLRLKSPPEIQPTGMLVIAVVGLVVNLLAMRVLTGGKEESLNVKGAYLEVWSGMLGSIGVIVGAIVIQLTGHGWVDSVVAILIGLWVVPRTWSLLKSSVNSLLEGGPGRNRVGRGAQRPARHSWRPKHPRPACLGGVEWQGEPDGSCRERPRDRRRARHPSGHPQRVAEALRHHPHHRPMRVGALRPNRRGPSLQESACADAGRAFRER